MNLFDFNKKFPTELSCVQHLRKLIEKRGIVCKECKCETKHWWIKSVKKFQCSVCDTRTNLKTGTIMSNSKVPLIKWFMCIHLMTSVKKSFSCLELQKQLGISRYQTVLDMMRKIRLSMGERDNRYDLKGDIEIDEGFFEVYDVPVYDDLGNRTNLRTQDLQRGRGSERQQQVLVMVESRPVEHTIKNKKKRVMGYVKMITIDSLTSDSINYEVKKSVDKESNIWSDSWNGYNRLTDIVDKHTKMVVRKKESMSKLPWVHTVISNCKKQLLGVHHSVSRDYLQTYLNEFCYKLNRRNFVTDLFDRMLICSVDM